MRSVRQFNIPTHIALLVKDQLRLWGPRKHVHIVLVKIARPLHIMPHDTGYCLVEKLILLAEKQHNNWSQNSLNVMLSCQIPFNDDQTSFAPTTDPTPHHNAIYHLQSCHIPPGIYQYTAYHDTA